MRGTLANVQTLHNINMLSQMMKVGGIFGPTRRIRKRQENKPDRGNTLAATLSFTRINVDSGDMQFFQGNVRTHDLKMVTINEIRTLLEHHQLSVSSICSRWTLRKSVSSFRMKNSFHGEQSHSVLAVTDGTVFHSYID